MSTLPQIFGSMVFNDAVMREYLPEDVYKAMKRTIEVGKSLDMEVANVVANAMKDWAVGHGATHFTHWFQPMTGGTAEKHDSFISPTGDGGVLMNFSGKELIKGEPDASSFPSGGLRYTAQARGYTAWDPTSYAFIKENTLYIPTAFCSYGGEALDKKTPLLRSMEAVNKQALRVLHCLGSKAAHVRANVGPEQEFFLIDKKMYDKREDLIFCGRTLFGARPPKAQELDDHYLAVLNPRVAAFMAEVDEELWKLGIMSKTEHNETAPCQHEMAPIFTTVNIATDQNQLVMELLQKIAGRHGLACLLHEKPFAGINGSGKHNNWSLSTDLGENLFEPGEEPDQNLRFLVFLAAIIKAVDDHQDVLRVCCATAGNDHRLGATEAPPAVLSIYLGDDITRVLESVVNECPYDGAQRTEMRVGVSTAPRFLKDPTDRNRTSPFVFTGNKFEFRMVGSSYSISGPNIILDTIMADALCDFADKLEQGMPPMQLVRETVKAHQRILFNGNGYSPAWVQEAEKRGLLNLQSTPEALPFFVRPENIDLFQKYGVFSPEETCSRYEIWVDGYIKTLEIEARTMSDMVAKKIMPAVSEYTEALAGALLSKKQACPGASTYTEETLLKQVSALGESLYKKQEHLQQMMIKAQSVALPQKRAEFVRENLFVTLQEMRGVIDTLETMVGKKYWPYPTYGEMLFNV